MGQAAGKEEHSLGSVTVFQPGKLITFSLPQPRWPKSKAREGSHGQGAKLWAPRIAGVCYPLCMGE